MLLFQPNSTHVRDLFFNTLQHWNLGIYEPISLLEQLSFQQDDGQSSWVSLPPHTISLRSTLRVLPAE